MNKKFIAVVILSMIFLGAICGYTVAANLSWVLSEVN